jgi:hypothetical protein
MLPGTTISALIFNFLIRFLFQGIHPMGIFPVMRVFGHGLIMDHGSFQWIFEGNCKKRLLPKMIRLDFFLKKTIKNPLCLPIGCIKKLQQKDDRAARCRIRLS